MQILYHINKVLKEVIFLKINKIELINLQVEVLNNYQWEIVN